MNKIVSRIAIGIAVLCSLTFTGCADTPKAITAIPTPPPPRVVTNTQTQQVVVDRYICGSCRNVFDFKAGPCPTCAAKAAAEAAAKAAAATPPAPTNSLGLTPQVVDLPCCGPYGGTIVLQPPTMAPQLVMTPQVPVPVAAMPPQQNMTVIVQQAPFSFPQGVTQVIQSDYYRGPAPINDGGVDEVIYHNGPVSYYTGAVMPGGTTYSGPQYYNGGSGNALMYYNGAVIGGGRPYYNSNYEPRRQHYYHR